MERQVWCSIAAVEWDQDGVGGAVVDIRGDLGERRDVHVGRRRICEDDERRYPSDVEVAAILLSSRDPKHVIMASYPAPGPVTSVNGAVKVDAIACTAAATAGPWSGQFSTVFRGAPAVSWQLSVKFKGTVELVG